VWEKWGWFLGDISSWATPKPWWSLLYSTIVLYDMYIQGNWHLYLVMVSSCKVMALHYFPWPLYSFVTACGQAGWQEGNSTQLEFVMHQQLAVTQPCQYCTESVIMKCRCLILTSILHDVLIILEMWLWSSAIHPMDCSDSLFLLRNYEWLKPGLSMNRNNLRLPCCWCWFFIKLCGNLYLTWEHDLAKDLAKDNLLHV